MAIDGKALREFEDIVGGENLSDDPAILDSYACHATWYGVPSQGLLNSIWWKRAGAVVLPGSAEEVQQVVRICNRYGVKFKAHSTGQAPNAFPWTDRAIILDLRRMDRILEINEEHMYALVEPYVNQAELFVETIRKGLVPHMIDAGCSISPLASVTSVHGEGDSGITRGINHRNSMAVEWVLPNGELLKLGSPNTPGAGWFCGDGPGPSLLGVMRGAMGHMGEMGVFTKAAIKLYPWDGPAELDTGGEPPWFDLKLWPLSDLFLVKWDDYRDEKEALYLIGEAEIFESFGRLSTTKFEAVVSESKSEWVAIHKSRIIRDLFSKGGWFSLIAAKTQEQFDYRHRALASILERTHGTLIRPETDIPVPAGINNPESWGARLKSAILQMVVLKNLTLKACEMPSAGTQGPFPAMQGNSIDKIFEIMQEVQFPVKEKLQREGKMLDDGPDGNWCTIDEGGHWMMQMNFSRVERMDPKTAWCWEMNTSMAEALKRGLPLTDVFPRFESGEKIVPYQEKIGRMTDPNSLSRGVFSNLLTMLFGDDEEGDG